MSSYKRTSSEIALEILDCIDKKGEASRWDLTKILGTTWQFHHWVEDFLMKERLIEERQEARNYFYRKTETGELFHKLLKNGHVMRALLRVSGRRLRRS